MGVESFGSFASVAAGLAAPNLRTFPHLHLVRLPANLSLMLL